MTPGSADDAFEMLVAGGYLRQSSSGVFTFLSPVLLLLQFVQSVIDEEMSAIRATRIDMPTLLPTASWRKSGRIEAMGSELFQLKDRKGSEFLLAPTHEEEVTKLICSEIQSYKNLPVRVYQVTRKHRDEPRPRLGLLRAREFLMKDLYSFDEDLVRADKAYEDVRGAYRNIMDRLFGSGVWRMAEANSGAMGGKRSHEFHVEDPSGEDEILRCSSCSYTANSEAADCLVLPPASSGRESLLLSGDVNVYFFSDRPPQYSYAPSLVTLTALVLPKESQLNSAKASRLFENGQTRQIFPSTVRNKPQWSWDREGTPEGPVLNFDQLRIITDPSCLGLAEQKIEDAVRLAIIESNTATDHTPGPDDLTRAPSLADWFPRAVTLEYADVRTATKGSRCPRCLNGTLQRSKAFEVGHTFLLGTRYTESLDYEFAARPTGDRKQQERNRIQMGCYGLGITRILGVLAIHARRAFLELERHSKAQQATSSSSPAPGLLWPEHIAPYTHALVLAPPSAKSYETTGWKGTLDDAVERVSSRRDIAGVACESATLSYPRILLDDRVPVTVYGDDAVEDDVASRFKTLGMTARLRDIDMLGVPHVWILRPAIGDGQNTTISQPHYEIQELR